MKKTLLFLLLIIALTSYGQEFSFPIFFTDAIGNKDTITLGYDLLASDSIDVLLGEENIIDTPFKSGLDVRITNEWRNRNMSGISKPGTYHTKKQITYYDCPEFLSAHIQTIDILTEHWPVTATWDKTLFSDSCVSGSVFTSINPGGWWDTGSPSDLSVQLQSYFDSVTFSSNAEDGQYYNENYSYIKGSDTIPVFWQAIMGNTSTSIAESSNGGSELNVYPIPFYNQINFSLNKPLEVTVSIYDFVGREIFRDSFKNTLTISTDSFLTGAYFFVVTNKEGVISRGKVVKQ